MTLASRPPAPAPSTTRTRFALAAAALVCAGCAAPPTVPPASPPAPGAAVVVPPVAPARPVLEPPVAPRASLPESIPPAPATPSGTAPSRAAGEPPAPAGGATAAPPFDAGGALTLEAGLYRCELDRRVIVRRVASDGRSLVINWRGRDSVLHAVQARTGALRFENPDTGHVWLVIVGKSMLLDARAGRTLANECRL